MSSSETRPSTVLFPLVHHSGAFNKAPSQATVRAALNPKPSNSDELEEGLDEAEMDAGTLDDVSRYAEF